MAYESKTPAAMDPELYLKKHHVMTYVEDAITLLLERKDEDAKTKPFVVLAEYFKSVQSGNHVLFREYSFVSATPHNRRSFLQLFWQSYTKVAIRGESMQVMEYLSLLRLLCHDFPSGLVQRVAQFTFSHNAMENMLPFSDFLYTFQVIFYYEQFLAQCEALVSNVVAGHSLLRTTVVVAIPSSADIRPANEAQQGRGELTPEKNKQIDAEVFLKVVTNLINKMQEREVWNSCPGVETVREVTSELANLSFYDFVLALSNSSHVNAEIGALPPKAQLLQDSTEAL